MSHIDTRYARIQGAMQNHLARRVPVQRQDSLTDQLTDVWIIAAKLGCYDAADWLWKNADLEAHVAPVLRPSGDDVRPLRGENE